MRLFGSRRMAAAGGVCDGVAWSGSAGVGDGGVCVSGMAQAPMNSEWLSSAIERIDGVKNRPYSLVKKTGYRWTRPDGIVMTTHSEEHEMRDSEGRTRREVGVVKDGQFEVWTVLLSDPVARISVTMDVRKKTASVGHSALTREQEVRMAEALAPADANRQEDQTLVSTYAEELQPETIAGVYATGSRRTVTLPARGDEIQLVSEAWRSADLKIIMRSATDDPQMGKFTMEVTELERNEPDPALFQIPPDYKVNVPGRK